MKAVVAELREQEAAVLCMDGVVRIVPDVGLEVGHVVEIEEESVRTKAAGFTPLSSLRHGYLIPAAAFAGMILTAGGVAAAVTIPVSTVTMDVSGSIEYNLNIFDKVVSVSAPDEKDLPLADSLREQIMGRNLSVAVERTLDVLAESGRILDEKESIEAAVESRFAREADLEEMLTDRIDHWNKFRETYGDSPVELSFRDAAGGIRPAQVQEKDQKSEHPGGAPSQPPQDKNGGVKKEQPESENADSKAPKAGQGANEKKESPAEPADKETPRQPEQAGNEADRQVGPVENEAAGQAGTAENGAAPQVDVAANGAAPQADAAGNGADPQAGAANNEAPPQADAANNGTDPQPGSPAANESGGQVP